MPGAVLRVSGSKAAVQRFLAQTVWEPLTVYWKGKPRFKSSTRLSDVNGFNVSVSLAGGSDLPAQVRDSIRFLRRHERELRRLKILRLSAVVDFGVEANDEYRPVYFRFPRSLIAALAAHGLDLEVSYYGASPQ